MTHRRRFALLLLTAFAGICLAPPAAHAADWPMWRCDASRSGASQQQLAAQLHLQWVIELPPLEPAWPDAPEMWFDAHYEPVVAGGRVFVGSSITDSLTAYDTGTGAALWTFAAEGPIRMAPAVDGGRVFVTSDDGYLYCVDAASGRLRWKFRGGPSDRKVLGNGRMVSMWPARGAPVVADGTVYFAASVWPFMGVFIHALDAETGEVRWTNDGEGSRFMQQPHNTNSFAGVAPQGPLVVAGDRLWIPGGRSVPACFDRHTGRFLYYELAASSKRGGGSHVAANEQMFFNGGYVYGADKGDIIGGLQFNGPVVLDENRLLMHDGDEVEAFEPGDPLFKTKQAKDRRGKPIEIRELVAKELWELALEEVPTDMILAGARLYGCSGQEVYALDLPGDDDEDRKRDRGDSKPAWSTSIEGNAARLLAADDRLFVVSREGAIYCFGAEKVDVRRHAHRPSPLAAATSEHENLAARGAREGYAVVWGAGDGGLVSALLSETELSVVVVEPDADRAAALRKSLVDAAMYGKRACVFVGTPRSIGLPSYFASAMYCEDLAAAGITPDAATLERMFSSLRPYGGAATLRTDDAAHRSIASSAKSLSRASVSWADGTTVLVREGALEDSADWTHGHADAANTRTSQDRLVRAPLGVLWFGGTSHEGVLPRHGHGPQPQVVDGRSIIEGPDMLRAIDIYTGRQLWERSLPGIGKLYDNTSHHPGANGTGTNFISLPEGIYAIHGDGCVRLDLATGEPTAEYRLPPLEGEEASPPWTYINAVGEYLIAGINLPESLLDPKQGFSYDDAVASKRLYVLERETGRVLWSYDARFEFRNNAICVGGGRLYCIDLLSDAELGALKRRGQKPEDKSRLVALDLATGRELWSSDNDVFGTWLSYSAQHDLLIESGRPGRDVLRDEPEGIRAWQAAEGRALWKEDYRGPAIIHGDRILADRNACDILTGKLLTRVDPLSGKEVTWTWSRNYGCNTPLASQHLLLFRSGAAGYYDLAGDGGTGNFGGFRSGCTNNLIAAGGVICAPDYTRTCTCDYQNQTSIALVHMPEVEVWTELPLDVDEEVTRLALNLGAPGYRRDATGQLWLHQFDGATIEHDEAGLYCHHSSRVADDPLAWVASSGCRGIRGVTVDLNRDEAARVQVRMHFCDPDNAASGARVFDVVLQGKTVLENFDIVAEAGGPNRRIVRQFVADVKKGEPLEIRFVADSAAAADPQNAPLLNGVELSVE